MPRCEQKIHRLTHRNQHVGPRRQRAVGHAAHLAIDGAGSDHCADCTRSQRLGNHGAVPKDFAHCRIVERAAHQQRAVGAKQGDGTAVADVHGFPRFVKIARLNGRNDRTGKLPVNFRHRTNRIDRPLIAAAADERIADEHVVRCRRTRALKISSVGCVDTQQCGVA